MFKAICCCGILLFSAVVVSSKLAAQEIHVLVWDERQPQQKEAYPDFLGNSIAAHLQNQEGLRVRSRWIEDPEQGLSAEDLDWADVLIWWGHVRQSEITPETAREKIISRIVAGELDLIALHSAHWSTPFVEAMNHRTRSDVEAVYPVDRSEITYVDPPGRFPPASESMMTPAVYALKTSSDRYRIRVDLPNCCFPGYRADGAASRLETLLPDHPIAKGLETGFVIQHTEMYDEPFHVPAPDHVIFKESWETGEWFRAGMLWQLGKGEVFYFRPGHETFPVYLQPEPLRVLDNAVRFLSASHEAQISQDEKQRP